MELMDARFRRPLPSRASIEACPHTVTLAHLAVRPERQTLTRGLWAMLRALTLSLPVRVRMPPSR